MLNIEHFSFTDSLQLHFICFLNFQESNMLHSSETCYSDCTQQFYTFSDNPTSSFKEKCSILSTFLLCLQYPWPITARAVIGQGYSQINRYYLSISKYNFCCFLENKIINNMTEKAKLRRTEKSLKVGSRVSVGPDFFGDKDRRQRYIGTVRKWVGVDNEMLKVEWDEDGSFTINSQGDLTLEGPEKTKFTLRIALPNNEEQSSSGEERPPSSPPVVKKARSDDQSTSFHIEGFFFYFSVIHI